MECLDKPVGILGIGGGQEHSGDKALFEQDVRNGVRLSPRLREGRLKLLAQEELPLALAKQMLATLLRQANLELH